MTNKLFDSFVSEKLKNYESPVPDGLWEKIMGQEEERKPVIIWWQNKMLLMLGFCVLLLLSTTGYFVATKYNSKNTIASANLKTTNKTGNISNSTTTKTDNKIIADTKINDNNNSNLGQNEINLKNNKNLQLIEIKEHKSKIKINIQKNSLYHNTNTNTSNSVGNSLMTDEQNQNLFASSRLKNKKNKPGFNSNNKSSVNSFSSYSDEVLNNNLFTKSTKANWEDIASQERNLINASTNSLKSFSLAKLFGDDCPTTRGSYRNDFYVEGYISPDVSFKTVKSTKQGNEQYLAKKDSSESTRLGFTVGARFSKSISNNLLLKAGLQYSQFNEKLTLRTENDRKVTIVINSHTITRPSLPDTTINDTTTTVQIGYRVRTNINHYKSLELPVLLSYEFSEPQSLWKFAVSGGAIVNLTSWYEGKTIDSSYNLVNISSKSNNGIFKHQVGVSLYASVSVMRNITKELDVFAEPYFRYGLSKSLQSTTGFTQSFNAFGIQFGARIKLSTNKHF